jgi:hypothetical protein
VGQVCQECRARLVHTRCISRAFRRLGADWARARQTFNSSVGADDSASFLCECGAKDCGKVIRLRVREFDAFCAISAGTLLEASSLTLYGSSTRPAQVFGAGIHARAPL